MLQECTPELESIFESSKHLPWNYKELSSNEFITWNMVRNNLSKPWDWFELSKHKVVTFDIIQDNAFLRWNWKSISQNPNITFDIIINNTECLWDYAILRNILSKENYEYLTESKYFIPLLD